MNHVSQDSATSRATNGSATRARARRAFQQKTGLKPRCMSREPRRCHDLRAADCAGRSSLLSSAVVIRPDRGRVRRRRGRAADVSVAPQASDAALRSVSAVHGERRDRLALPARRRRWTARARRETSRVIELVRRSAAHSSVVAACGVGEAAALWRGGGIW